MLAAFTLGALIFAIGVFMGAGIVQASYKGYPKEKKE